MPTPPPGISTIQYLLDLYNAAPERFRQGRAAYAGASDPKLEPWQSALQAGGGLMGMVSAPFAPAEKIGKDVMGKWNSMTSEPFIRGMGGSEQDVARSRHGAELGGEFAGGLVAGNALGTAAGAGIGALKNVAQTKLGPAFQAGRMAQRAKMTEAPLAEGAMGDLEPIAGGSDRMGWLRNPMETNAQGIPQPVRVTPELVAKAKAGDTEALATVVDGMQNMVTKSAYRIRRLGQTTMELDDLMAVGNEALVKLIQNPKVNPERFLPYANVVIDKTMHKAVRTATRAQRGGQAYTEDLGLADPAANIPDVPRSVLNKNLNDAMAKLTAKEREAVTLRLGLGEEAPKEFAEIGQIMGGIAKPNAFKLVKKGIDKISKELKALGIEPADIVPETSTPPPPRIGGPKSEGEVPPIAGGAPEKAAYAHYQEGYGNQPGFHNYNLTEDFRDPAGLVHPKGTTKSQRFLDENGIPYDAPIQGSSGAPLKQSIDQILDQTVGRLRQPNQVEPDPNMVRQFEAGMTKQNQPLAHLSNPGTTPEQVLSSHSAYRDINRTLNRAGQQTYEYPNNPVNPDTGIPEGFPEGTLTINDTTMMQIKGEAYAPKPNALEAWTDWFRSGRPRGGISGASDANLPGEYQSNTGLKEGLSMYAPGMSRAGGRNLPGQPFGQWSKEMEERMMQERPYTPPDEGAGRWPSMNAMTAEFAGDKNVPTGYGEPPRGLPRQALDMSTPEGVRRFLEMLDAYYGGHI